MAPRTGRIGFNASSEMVRSAEADTKADGAKSVGDPRFGWRFQEPDAEQWSEKAPLHGARTKTYSDFQNTDHGLAQSCVVPSLGNES